MPSDAYNRILKAAKRGVGVKLTAREVYALSTDDAICTRASVLRESDDPDVMTWEDQCAAFDAMEDSNA